MMVNPEGLTRWNLFTHVQSRWNRITVWEKRPQICRSEKQGPSQSMVTRNRKKNISKDVIWFYWVHHVKRHLLCVCLAQTFTGLLEHSRLSLMTASLIHPAAAALAHMTSALWIVLTRYLNKQEGPVTMLPNWCCGVISQRTDGKAASSSMCSHPRHAGALVVVQVSFKVPSDFLFYPNQI